MRAPQLRQVRSLVLLVVRLPSLSIFSPNPVRSIGRFCLLVQPMNTALRMREFLPLQETSTCLIRLLWRKSFLSAMALRASELLSTRHFWRETRIGLIRMRRSAQSKTFLVRECGRIGQSSIAAGHQSYLSFMNLLRQSNFTESTNLLLTLFGVRR